MFIGIYIYTYNEEARNGSLQFRIVHDTDQRGKYYEVFKDKDFKINSQQ